MFTFEQIKDLIQLVSERRLQGLEVERAGFRLKIDGQQAAPPALPPAAPAAPPLPAELSQAAPPVAAPAPAAAPASAPAAPEPASPPPAADDSHVLKSPIVGTFYRAASPESEPFVEVGSRVKVGQVLCIVEAMKLMNEIEADVAGEIVEIFAENAQPVEFGEPLFAIRQG